MSPKLVKVGETDTRQDVEEVGLGGTDAARGSLGAGAKSAANRHTITLRTRGTSPTGCQ
ncbi:hypothetical protein [Streptomyces sp. NPDC055692]|uniref:hypothetical protein n=1 Tax=Streptomyces sp. NPDC055692 TaxID=3155683 RepID=UPI00343F0E85